MHHRLRDPAASLTGSSRRWTSGWAVPSPHAHVDFGFHMAVTHWDERTRGDVGRLVDDGVPSFKVVHGAAGVPRGDRRRPPRPAARDQGARRPHHGARRERRRDRLPRGAEPATPAETKPVTHAETGPSGLEAEATSRAIWLAESVGAPLFVVHVSCRASGRRGRTARGRAACAVRAETCTHYLTLSADDLRQPDRRGDPLHLLAAAARARRTRTTCGGRCATTSSSPSRATTAPTPTHRSESGLDDFSLVPPGLAGHPASAAAALGARRARRPHLAEPAGRPHVDLRGADLRPAAAKGDDRARRGCRPGASSTRLGSYELSGSTSLMNVDYDLWEGQTVDGLPANDPLPRRDRLRGRADPQRARAEGAS